MAFPRVLKIAILPQKHIFEVNASINGSLIHSGIESKLLAILAQHLNFRYDLIEAVDGEWGAPRNDGTWTGMIGLVKSGKADIALGNIAITEKRYGVVDFSAPYNVQDKTFLTQMPELASKAGSFLRPMDLPTSILIFSVMLLITFLLKCIISKDVSTVDVAFKLFTSLLGQYSSFKSPSSFGRLIYSTWIAFSGILSIFYSSILLSFLTVPIRNPGIQNINQLTDAVEKGVYKVLAAKGSSDLEVLLNSKQPHLRRLGEIIVKNDWVYDFSKGIRNQICDHKTAVISARLHMYLTFGIKPSSMFISDDSFGKLFVGIALSKVFCCKESLNAILLRVRNSGLLQKFINEQLFVTHLNKPPMTRNKLSIDLEDIWPAFLILMSGLFLSLIIFFCECIIFNGNVKKSND